MVDIEKERELSKKGMDIEEQNIVEQVEEKESSLAADHESVTEHVNLNKRKNDSHRTSDDSSKKIIEQEDRKGGTSQDKTVDTTAEEKEGTNYTSQQLNEQTPEEKELNSPENTQVSEITEIESSASDSKNIKAEPEPEVTNEVDSTEASDVVGSASDKDVEGQIEEVEGEGLEEKVTGEAIKTSSESVDQEEEDEPAKGSISESSSDKPGKIAQKQKDIPAEVSDNQVGSEVATEQDDKESKNTSGLIAKAEDVEEDKDEQPNDDDLDDEEIDYSQLAKDDLINAFEKVLALEDLKIVEKKLRDLKPFYDDIVETEKAAALQKFIDEGGSEIDFQYVGDALDTRYHNLYEKYKGRRNAYYLELEKNKEENLVKKQVVLEKLRDIVDGEETNTSISALKNIQKEWRSIGPVPSPNAKSLWATYNILIDRFYDNRSIYFELKELDRKKNLEAKLELCEKAEQLHDYDVIRDAVKELNELHEEFKHIGPVPAEMQEVVWQRFKSASDAIYERRKDYVSSLKKELHGNLDSKMKLVEEVAKFNDYDSDKISEWNEKTKEILEIQKKWESIGGLPREHAKEINKNFWSSFKTFFNNKNKFFKKLESQRDENLLKKEALVKHAEELKTSNDWEKTAETLKGLQLEWKDVGPIPEKNRNEVYRRFKNACDTFFNRRREHSRELESEYKVNLKKKDEICMEIEKMVQEKDKNVEQFKKLQVKFNSIGYVPRNTIKKIQRKYNRVTELFLNSFDLSETEKSELRFAAEVDKLKSGPNADRKIQRKEVEVRRLIGKIENDIALWKNNIEFFAQSKTADKVKEEFIDKIEKATSQLKELREELKMLNKI